MAAFKNVNITIHELFHELLLRSDRNLLCVYRANKFVLVNSENMQIKANMKSRRELKGNGVGL